jgi:hypothetical protein
LDADAIRDAMLDITGVLNRKQFGVGFWDEKIDDAENKFRYAKFDPVGPEFNRRSIYRHRTRDERAYLLDSSDCPEIGRIRNPVKTPLGELHFDNTFSVRVSQLLAERVEREVKDDLPSQMQYMSVLVLQRELKPKQLERAMEFVKMHDLSLFALALFNTMEWNWIQ